MRCPGCGNNVSDLDEKCPVCKLDIEGYKQDIEYAENKFHKVVWLIILFVAILIVFSFIISNSITYKPTSSDITEKETTDEEIIEYAKSEIKKRLKYSDTAMFSNENISFQDNKYIVECYCTSKNGNKQETKVKFITIIEKCKNKLVCLDMMTNGETCTRDAKDIVEQLIKEKKYEEIFNEWFNSTEKNVMDYDKFINYLNEYPIDLAQASFEEKEYEENKKIELYIQEANNENRWYIWYFTFLNGQVYNFDIILKW